MHCVHWATQSGAEEAAVTVFCAVWHRQRSKIEWLRSHYENLLRQSVPVRIIYVFDGGDTPPDWLNADVYVFSDPVAIYEAWSAAVGLCSTSWVMNLNIDDRLATNAIELLLGAARSSSASLVCGEWEIEFGTDRVGSLFSAPTSVDTHFKPDWPPQVASGLRLGSGTGERKTFGPATLWNIDKVGKYYPSNFSNGEAIKSIGDALFWSLLQRTNERVIRLPMVIGRYLSDPNEQAEFRQHNDWESLKSHGLAQSCFADRLLSGEIGIFSR
jgi:hypothetical protein